MKYKSKPMSAGWYRKAYQLFADGINFQSETTNRMYYEVQGKEDVYSVIFDKFSKKNYCTCQGKSFWRVNKEHCSHTKACQIDRIVSKVMK